ncbi:MAG: lysophospholipid acyltransferase family protein [Candidatus Anammoxibacter sp.]
MYLVYSWPTAIGLWLMAYAVSIIFTIRSKRKEIIYNKISRFSARLIVQSLGIRVKIEGTENVPDNEPVIFVSNHQSLFDIELVFAYVPNEFSFISKESVANAPLIGEYMRKSGHITLKRESGKKAYETMVEAVDKLNMGKSLVVFPEGTRSSDGKLGQFKRGVSLIISQAGRKVVPMVIIGSGKFLSKDSIICNPQHREVTLRFGKPLTFEKKAKPNREDMNQIVERVRNSVLELLRKGI